MGSIRQNEEAAMGRWDENIRGGIGRAGSSSTMEGESGSWRRRKRGEEGNPSLKLRRRTPPPTYAFSLNHPQSVSHHEYTAAPSPSSTLNRLSLRAKANTLPCERQDSHPHTQCAPSSHVVPPRMSVSFQYSIFSFIVCRIEFSRMVSHHNALSLPSTNRAQ